MPNPDRIILHVDMDAFYAAIEQRDRPELRGRPVLVGGRGKRGVVTTASYEARPFGCRSAMPMARALRLCPHAVVVPVRMEAYAAVSRQVRAILERFSPDIEPLSIDEAFVDLTNVPTWSGRALHAARSIKDHVRKETSVTCSVGVAANKFLAKVASDLNKPDGLTEIPSKDAAEILAPLSVTVLWGVGRVAANELAKIGVQTVRDLLEFDERELIRRFGDSAARWRRLARGEDDRHVATSRESRSIGRERTFSDDIADPAALRAILMDELERAARQLREENLVCRRVALKLRRPDFQTYSRSGTLPEPSAATPDLWRTADTLLAEFLAQSPGPLRLIGVRLESLGQRGQLDLFAEQAGATRDRKLDDLSDTITARFGRHAILRAGSLGQQRRTRRPPATSL